MLEPRVATLLARGDWLWQNARPGIFRPALWRRLQQLVDAAEVRPARRARAVGPPTLAT